MKPLLCVWICLFLTGCVFGSNNAKGPPDSSWMQQVPVPVRNGETLGDYFWWSLDLKEALELQNRLQASEAEYYLDTQ